MGSAEVQGVLWGAAAQDWSELVEPLSTPLFEAVLAAVGASDGARLLDVGCGSGLALQLARERGAIVSGLDAAVGLLAIARARVPDADIRQGDLEDLPFDRGAFDAVTAFNSVQYAGDRVTAVRELARVARTGAPVAITTWGAPARCETRTVLAALGALLPPPPPGSGGPFALSEPGKLEELAASAGLTPKHTDEVLVPFVFPDIDTAVRGHLSAGPARRAIEVAGRDAVGEAIRGALEATVRSDGTSRQDNVFRYIVATA
jgi:SAM-dependent methyltransferase